jgi:ribonuclease-3
MIFQEFCTKINYQFSNLDLLKAAMTHPSLSKESAEKNNYQRLEFLGDKVLSLIIAQFLFQHFSNEMEGALSKRQAALVSGETLSEIALQIQINEILQMSEGEKKLGGANNKHNLENALEALIGAIYLDSNFENAKNFVLHFWQSFLTKDLNPPRDAVSLLQEIIQGKTKLLPSYQTTQSGGCDHAPEFSSIVKLPNSNLEFCGTGFSKKEAQKEAAKQALLHLKIEI